MGHMAGTITRLAFQKHAADRVNVYLDGQYAFALPALEAARLRVGEYLDDEAIARLQAQDERQKAYDRALRYLSFRPRSQAEVRRNLLAAGLEAGSGRGDAGPPGSAGLPGRRRICPFLGGKSAAVPT